MRYAIRYVMTRVLPDPAPARISSGPTVWSTASRCSGLSLSRKVMEERAYSVYGRPRITCYDPLFSNGGHSLQKSLGRARGPETSQRADATVRRPASRSRGDEPAGVRHAAGAGAAGRDAGAHDRDRRPYRADAGSA